jgi:hypothetical protein
VYERCSNELSALGVSQTIFMASKRGSDGECWETFCALHGDANWVENCALDLLEHSTGKKATMIGLKDLFNKLLCRKA